MRRGSDKHGPRIDEALSDETLSIRQGPPGESHTDQEKESEPWGEDQPPVEEVVRSADDAPDGTLSHAQTDLRRRIAASVEGRVFPATKDDLVANARAHHAERDVVIRLESLPEQEYENVQAVWEAIGGPRERRA